MIKFEPFGKIEIIMKGKKSIVKIYGIDDRLLDEQVTKKPLLMSGNWVQERKGKKLTIHKGNLSRAIINPNRVECFEIYLGE